MLRSTTPRLRVQRGASVLSRGMLPCKEVL